MHPLEIDLLDRSYMNTGGLRSKSWFEFAQLGAPTLDFVFTVCNTAAGEVVKPAPSIKLHIPGLDQLSPNLKFISYQGGQLLRTFKGVNGALRA